MTHKAKYEWRVWYRDDENRWIPCIQFLMTLREARVFKAELTACHPDSDYSIMDFVASFESFRPCCGISLAHNHSAACERYGAEDPEWQVMCDENSGSRVVARCGSAKAAEANLLSHRRANPSVPPHAYWIRDLACRPQVWKPL